MTPETYHLEFITPCFCAGADQAVAEIRAPAIRGKLRWWFRALGGTHCQEVEIFGTVHKEAKASAVVIRVKDFTANRKWRPIQCGGRTNTGYLLYFAKVSGYGCRWKPDGKGAIPEGSGFEIQIIWRRQPSKESRNLFDLALECFLMLGSFGLRSTRGLGCFHCAEVPFSTEKFNELKARIEKRGFLAGLGEYQGHESKLLLDALGKQLNGLRRKKGYSAGPNGSNLTPLGSSNPRQASAVYLRPVRESDNSYRIVVFEAPKEKVLGEKSGRRAPLLRGSIIPPPVDGSPGGRPPRWR
ncbi:MAG: hypothetical protein M2R45_03543 [Verrucomicrobia subdivision 3 bacterium]|nr:hypothetical protein [Limisphaerales bacterium]MCS1416480.1 hypothetical protein [Limisphaerales bacterium]